MKKASFTVEIALLMPCILLVIFTIISLCFYFHHKAWYAAYAYEAAISGSLEDVKREGRGEEIASRKTAEQEKEVLIGTGGVTTEVSKKGDTIVVRYETSVKSVFGSFEWPIKIEAKSDIIKPVKFIRTYRKLKGLGSSLLGEAS